MDLSQYFEAIGPDEIRIAGTRVGIEVVITAYQDGYSPEAIALDYPSLILEQIHATITYYLQNRDALDAYLARLDARFTATRARQESQPAPPVIARLRGLRAPSPHS